MKFVSPLTSGIAGRHCTGKRKMREIDQCTLVKNSQRKFWAICSSIRSSIRLFVLAPHSFACSALLARSAVLIPSLAHSLFAM